MWNSGERRSSREGWIGWCPSLPIAVVDVSGIRVRHCSAVAVFSVAERCQNLQVLSVRSSQNVTDKSIVKIALACPLLKELDISNCYEISCKSLEIVGSNCVQLNVLKRNLLNWLDPSQHSGIVPDDYLNSCLQDAWRQGSCYNCKIHAKLEAPRAEVLKANIIWTSNVIRGLQALGTFGSVRLRKPYRQGNRTGVSKSGKLKTLKKPNFYIPISMFHAERYGHRRLYDKRFQTIVFLI